MTVPGSWYLILAAVLFTIGALGLLIRRNVIVMFMCVELMLNAANLTFVTYSRMLDDIGGQALVFFVLVVAAAEVVVGLGIIVSIFRRRRSTLVLRGVSEAAVPHFGNTPAGTNILAASEAFTFVAKDKGVLFSMNNSLVGCHT